MKVWDHHEKVINKQESWEKKIDVIGDDIYFKIIPFM